MKTNKQQQLHGGFSLPLVMIFVAVSFLLLTGILRWSATGGALSQRYNEYYASLAAAEAATEKVVSAMSRDFQTGGVGAVDGNLANYGVLVPTTSETANWAGYNFDDPTGNQNATYVARLASWQYTDLNWKYTGFKGYAATYRIVSDARNTALGHNITSALKQDVQIADVPLFEFAVFYVPDMEICPGAADMTFTGRIHGNGSIYCQPSGRNVTFNDHVTAAHTILHTASPDDSTIRSFGSVTYRGEHDWNVSSLNLPLGASSSPAVLHGIIEEPPSSEPVNSLMGVQRYYNKADLIILVSNSTAIAKSGAYNNFATIVPWTNVASFVKTNLPPFIDKRESPDGSVKVQATQIDLQQFNTSYSQLTTLLGRNVKILYVADHRSIPNTELGVRLINGQTLPANGLTVATLNPLYVKGHYNAPAGTLGTTNTAGTAPASLIADAITILSGNWVDSNSGSSLPSRTATDTTINAAIIAGIVPSGGGSYSGGVENFFRLLENWSGRTLTFNGSIVCLFPSQTATGPWGSSDVQSPPQRAFSFDTKFKDKDSLPPGTPAARTTIRAAWTSVAPNSTQ